MSDHRISPCPAYLYFKSLRRRVYESVVMNDQRDWATDSPYRHFNKFVASRDMRMIHRVRNETKDLISKETT